jgi:hypothetical protein
MSWTRFLGVAASVFLCPATALAIYPMPNLQTPPLVTWPCDTASHPCNSCTSYPVNEAFQVQRSARSALSTDTPNPFGDCNGTHEWCKVPPVLQAPTYSAVRVGTQVLIQFSANYDFPNNYCLVFDLGDSCGPSSWPTLPGTHLTRLQLLEGANGIYDVPAIFENGTWMPTITASCDGSVHTYTIRVTNSGGFFDCATPTSVTVPLTVTFPNSTSQACRGPDLRPCPGCGPGGGK